MFEALNQIDTRLFLFINGQHSPFWDVVMWWASDKFIWIPLYILVLWFLIKQNTGKVSLLLLTIVLLVLVSDQFANLSKFIFPPASFAGTFIGGYDPFTVLLQRRSIWFLFGPCVQCICCGCFCDNTYRQKNEMANTCFTCLCLGGFLQQDIPWHSLPG